MSTETFKSFKIADLTVSPHNVRYKVCLLYTSDAADE